MNEKVTITLPNLGDVFIDASIVSKWKIDKCKIIGKTNFCVTNKSSFSISSEEYNKIFK